MALVDEKIASCSSIAAPRGILVLDESFTQNGFLQAMVARYVKNTSHVMQPASRIQVSKALSSGFFGSECRRWKT